MRKLTLKTERLTELTTAELRLAVGGAAYTGQVGCILSIQDDCLSRPVCTRDLVADTLLCA